MPVNSRCCSHLGQLTAQGTHSPHGPHGPHKQHTVTPTQQNNDERIQAAYGEPQARPALVSTTDLSTNQSAFTGAASAEDPEGPYRDAAAPFLPPTGSSSSNGLSFTPLGVGIGTPLEAGPGPALARALSGMGTRGGRGTLGRAQPPPGPGAMSLHSDPNLGPPQQHPTAMDTCCSKLVHPRGSGHQHRNDRVFGARNAAQSKPRANSSD